MENEHVKGMELGSKDGEVVRRWIGMVLGDKCLEDLPTALQSGEVLCDLINILYKALGMKSQICPVRGRHTDKDAEKNVHVYLRACEVLGVARVDLFQPQDLLDCKRMDKVYRNILALQSVAVLLSNRRSIDERSVMVTVPVTWSPQSNLANPDDRDAKELEPFTPESIQMRQQSRWLRLLFEYEYQQQRHEKRDISGESATITGLGPVAHGIWRTEERIRAILLRNDREYGAVPEELHGKLWMLASGAQIEMRKNKGQFTRLLATEVENTEASRQIDVDLHRTVAEEDKQHWTDEKTQMLRRILVAYSLYNPSLGYCQGLNYIVARSLHYLNEEEAFYLLVAMLQLVPEDYYTTMLGLAVDQHVFADLVRIQYPEIIQHLIELGGSGMELSLACTEWFLTLFASPCQRIVTFPIWDAIFFQGDEVLFKVALAFLQQAKKDLLESRNYGDMLNHLNELGRGNIDALSLMKVSRDQTCVLRSRLEDFRAHHRLQLASGIVASSVDAEDPRNSHHGRRSSEARADSKLRLFGRKKQGVSRHMDRIPPRFARTFDRVPSVEYIESIRRDHLNLAQYYQGFSPQIQEEYWGSAERSSQWSTRRVSTVCIDKLNDKTTHEQPNVLSCLNNEMHCSGRRTAPDGSNDCELDATRDCRSKSSGVVHEQASSCKLGTRNATNVRFTRMRDEEAGRSPLAWIQRFEEWHKELKIQKEKKKHAKRRRWHQRSDSLFNESNGWNTTISTELMTSQLKIPSPEVEMDSLERKSEDSESFNKEEIALLEEPLLARSSIDAFPSLPGIVGQRLRRPTRENLLSDTNRVMQLPSNGESRIAQGLSDQNTLSRSPHSYVNTASFTQEETHVHASLETEDVKEQGQGVSPTLTQLSIPPVHEFLYSPVQCQLIPSDFITRQSSASSVPPRGRQNVLLSNENSLSLSKPPCNSKRECLQVLRERANVLQYMHRKASDASSLAGSIPRSPAGISERSSDSFRVADQSQSGKSMPYRNSSFSFFDKLSSDLENSTHGLDSLVDESDFQGESSGRGSMSSVATG
ncbi:hypothetical protein CCR75_005551 [Bremia lactucae]|uniref:Rab-GAP TBC domain-containing protein n=1 Tax=Bremia lactucae TaxID=4779 RepID=A0A976IEJ1_BRELC|nr:hypothetical protein CCR75_005551 [Bremia lactucae]